MKKTSITFYSIFNFMGLINISQREYLLFLNAILRSYYIPSPDKMHGLGTVREYRSSFFKVLFPGKTVPRQSYWFTLSDKGLQIVNFWESMFEINRSEEERQAILSVINALNSIY